MTTDQKRTCAHQIPDAQKPFKEAGRNFLLQAPATWVLKDQIPGIHLVCLFRAIPLSSSETRESPVACWGSREGLVGLPLQHRFQTLPSQRDVMWSQQRNLSIV